MSSVPGKQRIWFVLGFHLHHLVPSLGQQPGPKPSSGHVNSSKHSEDVTRPEPGHRAAPAAREHAWTYVHSAAPGHLSLLGVQSFFGSPAGKSESCKPSAVYNQRSICLKELRGLINSVCKLPLGLPAPPPLPEAAMAGQGSVCCAELAVTPLWHGVCLALVTSAWPWSVGASIPAAQLPGPHPQPQLQRAAGSSSWASTMRNSKPGSRVARRGRRFSTGAGGPPGP